MSLDEVCVFVCGIAAVVGLGVQRNDEGTVRLERWREKTSSKFVLL